MQLDENIKDLDYWLKKVEESGQDLEIGKLADILIEAFIMWQLKGKEDEFKVDPETKRKKDLPQDHL